MGEVQRTRQAPPTRFTEPRLRDFVTDAEWAATRGPEAGKRLADIATPRWRREVDDWYAEWCGPYDDTTPVDVVDFDPAQRAAKAARDDETSRLMTWARAVAVGNFDPPWSDR